MAKKLTRGAVLETAKEVAAAFAGPRYRFEIAPAGLRQEDGWWYLPIIGETTDGRQLPHLFLTNVLANIETEIEKRLKANILLIPALPEPLPDAGAVLSSSSGVERA
ncbi:hypothetical protein BH11ARM2_BH11ARM2_25760 [soil metagenome]